MFAQNHPSLDYPYHAVFRTWTRDRFPFSLEECWGLFGEVLIYLNKIERLQIYASVLMSNHLHLLFSSESPVDQSVVRITRTLEAKIRSEIGSERIKFRLGMTWEEIHHPTYFGRAVKYIYRNPVQARLCSRVEEYIFSTIRAYLGQERLPFPLAENYFGLISVPREEEQFLRWLNTPFPESIL